MRIIAALHERGRAAYLSHLDMQRTLQRALLTSAAVQAFSGRTHRMYRAAARCPVRVPRFSGAAMAWDTAMPSGSTAFKRASKSAGATSPSSRTSNHSRSLSAPVARAPAKAMRG